ncbi:hypothetical protein KFK09_027544 [Dendrobium nobile]|uniref:Uncharacterized protein n=1 Tax=Dendrobium nobile TaxID=94219 RepID=A0A8T3AAV6_DENNO|nr:hypothetical protein KFK09_027544 [Dendrobium nobile]
MEQALKLFQRRNGTSSQAQTINNLSCFKTPQIYRRKGDSQTAKTSSNRANQVRGNGRPADGPEAAPEESYRESERQPQETRMNTTWNRNRQPKGEGTRNGKRNQEGKTEGPQRMGKSKKPLHIMC